jgi:hypothetical protein
MHLERAGIEATLRVVGASKAPGSHLVVMSQAPSFIRQLGGFFLRQSGEPFRPAFTADEMLTFSTNFCSGDSNSLEQILDTLEGVPLGDGSCFEI